jgi:hypothetical protein
MALWTILARKGQAPARPVAILSAASERLAVDEAAALRDRGALVGAEAKDILSARLATEAELEAWAEHMRRDLPPVLEPDDEKLGAVFRRRAQAHFARMRRGP